LEQSLSLKSDRVEAIYYLAKAYDAVDDTDSAKEYYQKILDDYPDSFYVNDARAYLK
jgi:TolA-binding protein